MDTFTVWGDGKEPLLSAVSWEDATEYVKGATHLKDLYVQNDKTGACFVYDGAQDDWEEE